MVMLTLTNAHAEILLYVLMQIHAHMLNNVYCYMYVSLHVNLKIYTVLAQVLIIAFSYLMFVCQKLQLIK